MAEDENAIRRQAIREWVDKQRSALEQAQSAGTLARTKLDIKDAAAAVFQNMFSSEPAVFSRVLDEELEAFCADMRLASVTVQQQVERRVPRTGLAIVAAVGAAFVALVVAALNVENPLLGFGIPVVVAVVVFTWVR